MTADAKASQAPKSAVPIPERTRPLAEKSAEQEVSASVPTNPALLEFPTDVWGFTSELKKAVLKAAGTVNAQVDKHMLLVDTLHLLIEHIEARFDTDAVTKAHFNDQARAAYRERHNRRRYNWVKPA